MKIWRYSNMPTLFASEDNKSNFIGIARDGSFTFALNDSIILNADLKFSNNASYYWYSEDNQYQINFGAYKMKKLSFKTLENQTMPIAILALKHAS